MLDNNLNHRYIIYNNADYKDGTNDENGYNTICLLDLKKVEGVTIIGGPMPRMPRLLSYLMRLLRKLGVPCKVIKPFVKKDKRDSRDLCVLFLRIFDATYLNWLRLQYPKAKFVLFLRDLYETKQPHVTYYKREHLIDYWGTFDINEKERYGMHFHYPEIESTVDISTCSKVPACDLFFAGAAKDRYSLLIDAYDYFEYHGIKCHFIIMDVDDNEEQIRDGIEYTNEFIPYRKMLEYSISAKCMLEIVQEGAVGNTSRFLEAVIYNKKLISNNKSILGEKYYNQKYIKLFNSITEVDPTFVVDEMNVDYGYEGDFSPVGLIKHIDDVICK